MTINGCMGSTPIGATIIIIVKKNPQVFSGQYLLERWPSGLRQQS